MPLVQQSAVGIHHAVYLPSHVPAIKDSLNLSSTSSRSNRARHHQQESCGIIVEPLKSKMDDLEFQTVVHKKNRKPKSETKPLPPPVQDDEPWVVRMPNRNARLEPDVRNVEEVTFCTPHRRDLIFSKARAAVIAHNRSTFAYFCDPVRLEALTAATTTFSGAESNVQKLTLVL